jgi:hypothetical protein
MTEIMQRSWDAFKVSGKPGYKGCQRLDRTGHVTHVEAALDMFRDQRIRPKLVLDGSRLDTERVEVVFSSPYNWANPWGCMFGNVLFEFDWAKITKGKNIYWLGAKKYGSLRPRILITDDEHSEFKRYLPGKRNGPWWRSKTTGRDYWNSHYGVEFLTEGELRLHQVAQMKFIKGHPKHCLLATCPDNGHDRTYAAARLLAGACHHGLLPISRRLWVKNANKPRQALKYAWRQLRTLLLAAKQQWGGPIKADADSAKSQAWASLGAFYHRENNHRRKLLRQFVGPKNAIKTCALLIEDGLELREGTLSEL